jgi:DNA polymerase-3 subunit alpha (Gram-positive type)
MNDIYRELVDSLEIVAFDTETTGLHEGSRLVELGGLKFQSKNIKAEFPSVLINPEIPIPPRSSAVHKITDDMVLGKPTVHEVLRNFFEFCKGSLLLAHNASFDRMMVMGEVKRIGMEVADQALLDTHVLAKLWMSSCNLANFRLETLGKYFHLEIGTLHRAYDDAKLVMEIFQHIYDLALQTSGKSLTLSEFLKGKEFLRLKGNSC